MVPFTLNSWAAITGKKTSGSHFKMINIAFSGSRVNEITIIPAKKTILMSTNLLKSDDLNSNLDLITREDSSTAARQIAIHSVCICHPQNKTIVPKKNRGAFIGNPGFLESDRFVQL